MKTATSSSKTSTSTAVEKLKENVLSKPGEGPLSIEGLVNKSAEQLKMALPKHMSPERIVRIALTTLRVTPRLAACEPYSFLAALFQSAQLGLEPNLNGEAWIIPYQNQGKLMAQFQIGAYGLVKLFWNHQTATSLQVEKVHEKDLFEYDLGSNTVRHIPPAFGKDRGDVIGYYAAAELVNGGRVLKVLSKNEAEIFARKFSKCFREGAFMRGTPWAEHFDEMAKKTVLKQLMKLLPKSIEIQRALAMDETVKTFVPGQTRIDGDLVSLPDQADHSTEETEESAVDRIPGEEG